MRKIVACGQRLRREGLVLVAAGSARWPMGGCAGPPGARDTVRRDACARSVPRWACNAQAYPLGIPAYPTLLPDIGPAWRGRQTLERPEG